MEFSVQNIYGLLIRSRLLPLEEVKSLFQRWQSQAKDTNDAGEFAKWMVAHQYLTEYQAALLGCGHADCFFLNQYKILDRLGKGHMAGVYKAVHYLGQTVAIKVLPPSKTRDSQLLGRFLREARLAQRLTHSNVVRTFQVGEDRGLHYLVMEHLEGETLADVLARRGKLPPSEAVRLMYQAFLGLQYIFEQGIIHRDLKPANLMVMPYSGTSSLDSTLRSFIKILDMSLARALSDDPLVEKMDDPQLTTEGVLLGTPDYMAPEQARDAHMVDIRADIYSLGCVLYHLLTGQPPFPDTNIISQMIRHATETPRPLKEFNPAIPDGLQQMVQRMLAKNPSQRYATPESAAKALQAFQAAGAEQPPPAADAKMNSYLTWLERGNDNVSDSSSPVKEVKTSPTSPSVIPVAMPVTASKPSVPPLAAPVVVTKQSLSQLPTPGGSAGANRALASPLAEIATPAAIQPAEAAPALTGNEPRSTPSVLSAASPNPTIESDKRAQTPGQKSRSPKSSQRKMRHPIAKPSISPEMPTIDVELVPVPSPPQSSVPEKAWWDLRRLSRRDFLMFSLGTGSVLTAIFLGWLMAAVFRK